MENNWKIIDDQGVIHSGTQDEMEDAWDVMVAPDSSTFTDEAKEKYACDWIGDLKLVEVHKRWR